MLCACLHAQEYYQEKPPKKLCLGDDYYDKCRSFLITDFALAGSFAISSGVGKAYFEQGGTYYLNWEWGWMKNLNRRYSLGGSLYSGINFEAYHWGLKFRLRRWLSRHVNFDFAPGILLGHVYDESNADESYPGFTGHIGLNVGNYVGFILQMESLRATAWVYEPSLGQSAEKNGTVTAWYAGVKLRSEAGIVPGILGLIVAMLSFGLSGLSGLD